MNKRILIASGCCFAAVVALAATTNDASPKLKAFATALNNAQTYSAKYSVQPLGGTPVEYSVALTKPNKARLETPDTLTIADGTTVVVYNKSGNTYMKQPQTEATLLGIFSSVETSVWKPFFKADSINDVVSKDLGTKTRGGKPYSVVSIKPDAKSDVTANLYLDQQDTLRMGEITKAAQGKDPETQILLVSEIGQATDDLFAFKAPNGSKEIKESDIAAGVWMTDFNKALQASNASGKMVICDFMASWCGPCKMMDAEVFHSEKFKAMSKDFILVKVDVDEQKDIASRYGITAMPTVKFLKGDGSVVHEFVGYGGPDQVYGEIATAKSKFVK